jgi:hypothetical protein
MKRSIILFLLILASTRLYAQDVVSNTQGLTIGASLNYCRWSSSYFNPLDENEPNGLGAGLRVGYGLSQRFEIYARLDGHTFAINLPEEWDTYSMAALEGGLRLNLGGTLQRVRPFFELGLSQQYFLIDPVFYTNDFQPYRVQLRGPAVVGSGGLNVFLTPGLALNVSLGGSIGKVNTYSRDEEVFDDRPDIRTLKANVGLTYFIH